MFDNNACPNESRLDEEKGVSPPARSTSSDAAGCIVNVELVNPKSAVKQTVPDWSLNVIVLSAVGFVTTKNVSKASSAPVPSKVILSPTTVRVDGDKAATSNDPVIEISPTDIEVAAIAAKFKVPDSRAETSVTKLLNSFLKFSIVPIFETCAVLILSVDYPPILLVNPLFHASHFLNYLSLL